MFLSKAVSVCLLAFTSTVLAAPPVSVLEDRDTVCTNAPNTRSCWKGGYSTASNWYNKFPDTGNVVRYYFTVDNVTMAPDGFSRPMMVFNGQFPGPTITADWGDTIEITIENKLQNNGTSIHWHGLRQLNSNQNDGTNGLTECPIAPGQTKVYRFKATEYGTSWYHSHFSGQYAEGLVGTIVINGPTTSNYDIDLPVVSLMDWYHIPYFTLLASRPAAPPQSQSVLVNGKGKYQGGGSYSVTQLTPGKRHKLRLVNTGNNAYIHVSLDNHAFTVVAADFVPVKPFVTNTLTLSIGQRYDVIVNANQTVGNYWFRVSTGVGCDGPTEKTDNLGAIFRYDGAPASDPTSVGITLPSGCSDETVTPFLALNPPAPSSSPTQLTLTLDTTAGVFWKVNGEAMHIDWTKPTLQYIQNGTYTLPADDNGLTVSGTSTTWVYWLIQNNTPLPHPMHLHGHDFYVVGQGAGSGVGASLQLTNPIRRDTATVPSGGYLTLAWKADNPGAWLLHCHIPFHISGGLGVQFIERGSEVLNTIGDLSAFNQGCKTWTSYQNSIPNFDQGDSGLRRRTMMTIEV